jgi:hypothetical protein
MIKIVTTIFICVILVSCYRNETCRPYYIGEFRIDTTQIGNSQCLVYVKKYRWDTIKLISKDNGKYFFETEDERLKECEGKWWTSSNNIEGECFGHIKQKNLKADISKMAFDITIIISNEAYSLPFRKVNSTGKFIRPSS